MVVEVTTTDMDVVATNRMAADVPTLMVVAASQPTAATPSTAEHLSTVAIRNTAAQASTAAAMAAATVVHNRPRILKPAALP